MFGPLKQNNGNSKTTKKEGCITITESRLLSTYAKLFEKLYFLAPDQWVRNVKLSEFFLRA